MKMKNFKINQKKIEKYINISDNYKKFEKYLKEKTIDNIDFLIDTITLLIKNAYTKELINIKLEEFILKVVNDIYNEYSKQYENIKEINDLTYYYLNSIKCIIGYYFNNLSTTLLVNSNDVLYIENNLQCALHMYFNLKFNKSSADDIIKKYYDYYYSIDNDNCEILFDKKILDNNIKKSIILDGIYIFIKKCNDLKIDFEYEYVKHIKQWSVNSNIMNLNDNSLSTQCPICFECNNLSKIVKTDCNHSYCYDCFSNMKKFLKPYHIPLCPLCRTPAKELCIYQI